MTDFRQCQTFAATSASWPRSGCVFSIERFRANLTRLKIGSTQ